MFERTSLLKIFRVKLSDNVYEIYHVRGSCRITSMSDENKWLMVYIHLCHESVHLHRSTHPRRSTLRLAKPDDLGFALFYLSGLCFLIVRPFRFRHLPWASPASRKIARQRCRKEKTWYVEFRERAKPRPFHALTVNDREAAGALEAVNDSCWAIGSGVRGGRLPRMILCSLTLQSSSIAGRDLETALLHTSKRGRLRHWTRCCDAM